MNYQDYSLETDNIVAAGARLVQKFGPYQGCETAERFATFHARGTPGRLFWRAVAESIRDAHGVEL